MLVQFQTKRLSNPTSGCSGKNESMQRTNA